MSRFSGGCQCGAVRFAAEDLIRASICHCRMCQKALAAPFGAFVRVGKVEWTRGQPRHFRSSNIARRGFCGECGTPLTCETDGEPVDLAICAFDDPAAVPPLRQLDVATRVPWFDRLAALPVLTPEEQAKSDSFEAGVVSYQHPDRDTADWKPRS